MKIPDLSTRHAVTAVIALNIFLAAGPSLYAQTWSDLVHPEEPHVFASGLRMSIPHQLITDPDETVILPVVVVLLEYQGLDHQPQHTPAFYQDFLFGTGGGEWTSQGPSLSQILLETSNGRLLIVPAAETDTSDGGAVNDGIIGWARTQCPPGMSGYYCVQGSEDGQSCDPANPTVCQDGGGHCAQCDTFEYHAYKDYKMRAEAVRLAEPYINFAAYDTMDSNWNPGADGEVTDNELAFMFIHAMAGCVDWHDAPGHNSWGNNRCDGGTTRGTDPSPIEIDGILLRQNPGEIPEGGIAQVLAHEFHHQVFGLPDLYRDGDYNECNPKLITQDGNICYPCKIDDANPQAACNDACGDAACVEDGAIWGAGYVARGSTAYCGGSDETTGCGANDSVDVWYTYTPDVSATVDITLTTVTGNHVKTLAVFNGCNGAEIAGDCTAPTQLSVPMAGGATYWIRVSAIYGDTGTYELNIEGGRGTCNYPHDSKWWPQLAARLSIMHDAWSYMPHLSPWANMHLGFTRPKILMDDGTYTIHRAETVRSSTEQISYPESLVILNFWHGDFSKEYYILENRAPEHRSGGSTIDEGLALWLVSEPYPGDNSLVAKRTLQLIRPQIWAPENESLWDGADPNYYDLSATSEPKNSHWTDGSPSYIDIRNISAAGPTMTVDIRLPGVFVDSANPGLGVGTPDDPLLTVSHAVSVIEAWARRWTIRIAPGSYPEAGLIIDTPCHITNWGEGTAYIGQ